MTQSTFFQIRSLLDEAERRIVIMHETPDGVLQVIQQVDAIDRLLDELADPVYDTRAEESRAEALRERLVRESGRTVRLVRAGRFEGQLADSPIWQRVSATHQQRQQRQRRSLINAGAFLALAAVLLFVVVPWVFPPTPIANSDAIARRAIAQDLPGAIEQARTEQARAPEDPISIVWLGALYEQQGDANAAQAAWEQAQTLMQDPAGFSFDRGQVRLQLGNLEGAEADARDLIARPDSAAQGYLLLGTVQEVRGQDREAIASYEQAGRLGDQIGNAQITVAARTRIAFILQRPNLPTPAP